MTNIVQGAKFSSKGTTDMELDSFDGGNEFEHIILISWIYLPYLQLRTIFLHEWKLCDGI